MDPHQDSSPGHHHVTTKLRDFYYTAREFGHVTLLEISSTDYEWKPQSQGNLWILLDLHI